MFQLRTEGADELPIDLLLPVVLANDLANQFQSLLEAFNQKFQTMAIFAGTPVPTAIAARLRTESGARPPRRDPSVANVGRLPTRALRHANRTPALPVACFVVRAVCTHPSRFDLTDLPGRNSEWQFAKGFRCEL